MSKYYHGGVVGQAGKRASGCTSTPIRPRTSWRRATAHVSRTLRHPGASG